MKTLQIFMVCWIGLLTADLAAQEKESEDKQNNQENQSVDQPAGKLYWIFLTTGKSTEGVAPDDIQEMQAAHLANFKSLAEQKKLLTAGPLSDPEKKLRGIVVVRAKDRADLTGFFKDDPYVQNNYLKVEATEMQFEHGVIETKITPQGLEEYRIVILETNGQGDSRSLDDQTTRQFIDQMSSNKELLLTVYLPNSKFERAAVLVMPKGENDEQIKKIVQEIPAVKSGAWKPKILPLYMGKGTLKSS